MDPDQTRLRLLDLTQMIEVERSLAFIELGWHLAMLERHVIPAARHFHYIHKPFSNAFNALKSYHESLSNYVSLAREPQEQLSLLLERHFKAIDDFRQYQVIGQTYCKKPIPLFSGFRFDDK